jgi:Predicted ATPase
MIVIDNIPNFNDENVNEQQRFITLIDIIYEKNSNDGNFRCIVR